MTASYQKWTPNTAAGESTSGGSGQASLIVIAIFLVFSFYWTSQVLQNVLLCTEAGIFGSWYFAIDMSVKHPAWGAFKRATTYSFGSICFGSLIVALLDLLKALLHIMNQNAAAGGDTIAYICTCCAQCCLGCITWMVE